MIDGEGASVEAGGATEGGDGGSGAAESAASRARSRAPVRGGPPPQARETRGPQKPSQAVPDSEIKIAGFDDVDDDEPAPKPRKGKERPAAKETEREPAEGDDEAGEPEEAGEDGDEEQDDGAEEDDWTPEKIAAEKEALDERKKKLERSHVALTEKRQKLAARERAVAEKEARVQRETEAAGNLFQTQYGKIQAFDQIRELAQRSDPKLIEVLGLDIEKLSRYHVEEGTPLEAERRHGETLKQLNARLDAEEKARKEAEERFKASQEAQESVRGFVRLARQSTDLPLVQRVLAADPDTLVEEATNLRARGMAQGHDWHGVGLLRRLEGRLRRLAERNGQAHTAAQRAPVSAKASGGPTTGKRPTVQRAEHGLGAEPGRRAPQSSPDPSSLDEKQLTALADRSLADLWRKDRRR